MNINIEVDAGDEILFDIIDFVAFWQIHVPGMHFDFQTILDVTRNFLAEFPYIEFESLSIPSEIEEDESISWQGAIGESFDMSEIKSGFIPEYVGLQGDLRGIVLNDWNESKVPLETIMCFGVGSAKLIRNSYTGTSVFIGVMCDLFINGEFSLVTRNASNSRRLPTSELIRNRTEFNASFSRFVQGINGIIVDHGSALDAQLVSKNGFRL